ncbi:dTDP-4-dehydrorhamnose 3,5-epimerase [Bradyrhizobium sp. CCBAU 11386]|uniref:dTDP-4-dehydrorhamnose 3,5-epimerase n=1 Tax=Bradyrhizobium sp. CCBAU 11386 TaxID=1630837 RepID=UPI0023036619|nr:dTDP-4-dehydrorhamnose 3,5-epimerase [Bradyrhizobium sp. CCBAU 11386]MDA9505050.1 dTDP-4-dehydrorhamnose 3,5-epimerase [Bradyrhizobium sp. CCBAU 11386]
MLNVVPTAIEAVKIITPKSFGDSRGVFSETYNQNRFFENGVALNFVQDNQASSKEAGTIRGLHFQIPPTAQAKLLRVLSGSVLDVAVDLRRSSPTFGKWVAETLSAENGKQILVPAGFAHGYCTLEPDTVVLYKVTDYWSPKDERGLAWDDPDLAIDWPVPREKALLAEKDTRWSKLSALPPFFD